MAKGNEHKNEPVQPSADQAGKNQERLRDRPAATERTGVDGAPGIPAGDKSVEDALKTPDSPLGGAVAADTTPQGPTGDEPSPEQVHRDDQKRNTL